jgi:GAF domain-containing protein
MSDGLKFPTADSGMKDGLQITEPAFVPLSPGELCALLSVRLEVILAMSQLTPKELSFQDLCQEILQYFRTAIPCEAGSLFEVSSSTNELFVRTAFGKAAAQIESFRIPLGQGIVGHVVESRDPMVLSGDVERSRIFIRQIADAVGFQARCILVVPIVVRGRSFAAVELLNRVGVGQFDKRDVETAMMLSKVAAAILEARLILAYALGAGAGEETGTFGDDQAA